MHESFVKDGSKVVMLVVEQKEPHAGTLAYKNISQPETVAERTELAKRMKEECDLTMPVLVDSMKDTSRALFTDLPSPAFVIDERGIIRAKMSWSQPEDISNFLKKLIAGEPTGSATTNKSDRGTTSKSSNGNTPTKSVSPVDLKSIRSIKKHAEEFEFKPPTQWVTVSIENQTGLPLCLQRVDFDDVRTVLQLGKANDLKLKLASGYYVLSTVKNSDSTERRPLRWPIPADARLVKKLNIKATLFRVPKDLRDQWSYIPAGPTVVGDVMGLGRDEERPAKIKQTKAFLMGRYEVSNQQYADFLNAQKVVPDDWIDFGSRKCLIEKDLFQSTRSAVYKTDSPDTPVVMVSRKGALRYCDWLTKRTKQTHRLATEAEWEKAARGPESFLYAYGNICRIKAANQESGHLRRSGQFAPNGFGLYDMTGNCWEWVAGEFATSTKLTGQLRGGSFIFDGIYNRNSFRMRQAPTVMTDDIGFRVVREIEPDASK